MAPPFLRPLARFVALVINIAGARMSEFSIRTKPFRLDWADYRALYLTQITHVVTTLPYALPTLFFVFGFPLLESLSDLRAGHYQTYLIVQLTTLAVCALTTAGGALVLWHRRGRDPAMNGERIMVMDAGAIRLIGPGFDIRQTWALVRGVRQSQDYIFLCLRGYKAYALPKRAFASAEDAERLAIAARAAIRMARKAPIPLPALPEAPDTRELWRSRPFIMALDRPLGRMLQRLGTRALAVFGCALLIAAMQSWPRGALNAGGILVLFGVLAVIFVPLLALLPVIWLIMHGQPDRRGPREVGFTRDYVRSTGAAADIRADWSLVEDVYRSSGTFVFRLAVGVFYVPASAFVTTAEATAFFTQAVAFWRAAEARR